MTKRFLCPTCVPRYYNLDNGEINSYIYIYTKISDIINLDRLEMKSNAGNEHDSLPEGSPLGLPLANRQLIHWTKL